MILFSGLAINTDSVLSHQPWALSQMEQFVRPDDPSVVKALADILSTNNQSTSNHDSPLADFNNVREWVINNIAYKSDKTSHGVSDYWQLPSETLATRTGDCEDSAILLCSLLRALGVQADQIYVAVGYDGIDWHAFIIENYYFNSIWRSIDAEKTDEDYFLCSNETSDYQIEYCFNDKNSFNGLPLTPTTGLYNFQLGSSYYPWDRGCSTFYSRQLVAGEKVTAKVMWMPDSPYSTFNSNILYLWGFNIYHEDGSPVLSWSGTDLNHEFSFNADTAGNYYIEILKRDTLPRSGLLSIDSIGWHTVFAEFNPLTDDYSFFNGAMDSYSPNYLAQAVHNPPSAELVQHILDLINQDRWAFAQLTPLALGTNIAAQVHAEDMLNNCFFSHWGSDGTSSDMRYRLSGGESYTAENIYVTRMNWAGINDKSLDQYISTLLDEAEASLMQNHPDMDWIVSPMFTKVNIGIAYDSEYLYLVQVFESDSFYGITSTPSVNDGKLSFTLQQIQSTPVSNELLISYNRLPQYLSSSQLNNARDTGMDRMLVAIVSYPGSTPSSIGNGVNSLAGFIDPYLVPINAPPLKPDSGNGVVPLVINPPMLAIKYMPLKGNRIAIDNNSFVFQIDLKPLIGLFGPGVYSINFCSSVVIARDTVSHLLVPTIMGEQFCIFVK